MPEPTTTPNSEAAQPKAAGAFVTNQPIDSHVVESVSPDMIMSDVDRKVTVMNPSSTPVDQILRYAVGANKACTSMKVEHYALDRMKESTKLKTQHTKGVKARVTLAVEDEDVFEVTDTILFPTVKNEDGSPVMACVVAKNDEGAPIVVAVNGEECKDKEDEYTLLPDIPAGALMVRMGRAAGELDVQSPAIEGVPTKDYNYCQIFKAQIEAGKLFERMEKEVDWKFTDQEENAIYELRRGMEYAFMFGQRGKFYDTVAKQHKWFCGGIWNQAGKELVYEEGSLTKQFFVDLTKKAFVGNNGSNKRILLGGSELIAALSKLDIDKQQNATETEVVWGITFKKIVTNFGTLDVLFDEVFDKVGAPGNGIVIDPQFISKRIFQPLGKLDLDLVKAGVRNTDARVLTEISCPVVKYPDAHMRIVCTPKA